jgi:predicted transcriptional regulator
MVLAFDGAPSGLWLAVIGVFLVFAASAERVHEQLVTRFTGIPAAELMSHPAISLPCEWTLAQAHEYFARYRYKAFPVTDNSGRAVGMLSIDQLSRTPRARWDTTSVGGRVERDPALRVGEREGVGQLLEEPAFARVGRAAVIDDDGRPVGVLSLTDIERAIRVSQLGGPSTGATRLA